MAVADLTLALAVVTSTASRPLAGLELDLYQALSETVARAETAEAQLELCEAREPELPDWVWPVVGVAAGLGAAGAAVLVIEAGR